MAKAKDNFVVASKVKEFIKKGGCMTASDTVDAINGAVNTILKQAITRTKANKRSTVRPQDV